MQIALFQTEVHTSIRGSMPRVAWNEFSFSPPDRVLVAISKALKTVNIWTKRHTSHPQKSRSAAKIPQTPDTIQISKVVSCRALDIAIQSLPIFNNFCPRLFWSAARLPIKTDKEKTKWKRIEGEEDRKKIERKQESRLNFVCTMLDNNFISDIAGRLVE